MSKTGQLYLEQQEMIGNILNDMKKWHISKGQLIRAYNEMEDYNTVKRDSAIYDTIIHFFRNNKESDISTDELLVNLAKEILKVMDY